MKKIFKVATRSSPLAMKQAEMAVEYFSKKIENSTFEILPFKTLGDKKLEWSLEKEGGKGLFTKELEDALLNNEADFAVHSAKDMPVECPDGLAIAAFLPRDDARDTFISNSDNLKVIATASPRRRAQLKRIYPDVEWTQIRGNVATRLGKLCAGLADATMLSAAGLDRLGINSFENLKFNRLDFSTCVPAVGQGVIAIECRTEDFGLFSQFTHLPTTLAVSLEREFLSALGGGCQVAFGAHFDGKIFRIFHEKISYKEFDFSSCNSQDEMLQKVREIAKDILKSS